MVTLESLDNAFALDMAMGGSTNTVLHTLAIAMRRAWNIPWSASTKSPPRTLPLQGFAPRMDVHMEDVDRAGGISAILKRTGAQARNP